MKIGAFLIVLGIAGIVWGVLHVLEAANGPGTGPTSFAARRSYNQVKVDVHTSFPGGLLRAGLGFASAWLGSWILQSKKIEGAPPGDGAPL